MSNTTIGISGGSVGVVAILGAVIYSKTTLYLDENGKR